MKPELRGAEDVDAVWLERVLRAAGHPDAKIEDVRAQRIGTGQIGKCIRYQLQLARGSGEAPASLVGKFASDDASSRATGIQLGNYLREVRFYQELAPRLSIRTPRCYFAEIEGDADFALILEDLAPAKPGDQIAGCSVRVARAAVEELAGLHGPSWCDGSLRGVDWIGEPTPERVELGRQMYAGMVGAFLERFGSRLQPDEVEIIERVATSSGPPFSGPDDLFSLVHVDYRLDNLLIDESREPPSVAAVDWQSVTIGHPLSDVAYFVGAALPPDERRACERELVDAYHAALARSGIGSYDRKSCWQDYRRGAFAGFAVTVIASMMVGATERGDEMFTVMARRHARHAIDLGSAEFLGNRVRGLSEERSRSSRAESG